MSATSLLEHLPLHAPDPGKQPASRDLPGLRFIRLVAALQVAAFHLCAWPWGRTWLSFFFLLSGFGAAYSKLQSAAGSGEQAVPWLPQPKTLLRRWASLKWLVACVFALAIWLFASTYVQVIDEVYYLGVYAFGALLAHYMPRRAEDAPLAAQVSASAAAVVLVVLFVTRQPLPPVEWTLVAVHVALLYGLAVGTDPLVKLLSIWPLPLLSEVSLGVYLFHFPVSRWMLNNGLVSGMFGSLGLLQYATCMLATTVTASAVHYCVQRPVGRWLSGLM